MTVTVAGTAPSAATHLRRTLAGGGNTASTRMRGSGFIGSSTREDQFTPGLRPRRPEKRAAAVVNHLQQVCKWKPYRMLTPTGMATADPAADNTTAAGRAQNRRVSVNVLVSKALDGQ